MTLHQLQNDLGKYPQLCTEAAGFTWPITLTREGAALHSPPQHKLVSLLALPPLVRSLVTPHALLVMLSTHITDCSEALWIWVLFW